MQMKIKKFETKIWNKIIKQQQLNEKFTTLK